MEDWYAIFVQTGHEEAVKKNLIDCLKDKAKPVIVKRRLKERKKGVWTEVEKNLYPGYILIYGRFDKYSYKDVNKISGIIKILSDQDGPIPIEKSEMKTIERLIDIDGIIGYSTGIIKDHKVIITDGPLKDLQGLVKSVDKRKQRAKVKINFLGEEKLVDLGIDILRGE